MFCILCALAIGEHRCESTPFLIRRRRRPGGRQEVTAASTAAVPDPVKRMGTKFPPGANARMSLSRMPSIKSLNSDSRWQMSGFSNACRTRSDTLTGPGFNKIMTRAAGVAETRSEEHTSELQSRSDLVCRLLLEKKKRTSSYGRFADDLAEQ